MNSKYSDVIKQRRSYYQIGKELPIPREQVLQLIDEVTELVPDAFNMKSARLIVVTEEKQDQLWDAIYDVFDGKVPREKIDSFKAGYGTILFYIDMSVVENVMDQFPLYAHNFPVWANHANGMLQFSLWSSLREQGIGASLQHYNLVIDEKLSELFDVPESWKLIAQMPFGNILAEPEAKEKEDIRQRVRVF